MSYLTRPKKSPKTLTPAIDVPKVEQPKQNKIISKSTARTIMLIALFTTLNPINAALPHVSPSKNQDIIKIRNKQILPKQLKSFLNITDEISNNRQLIELQLDRKKIQDKLDYMKYLKSKRILQTEDEYYYDYGDYGTDWWDDYWANYGNETPPSAPPKRKYYESDLGDVVMSVIKSSDYTLLLKSDQVIQDKNPFGGNVKVVYQSNNNVKCLSCDEGMYMYPAIDSHYESGGTNPEIYTNFCVPDCSTVNYQYVNNPENGRCEWLGYYCAYGNYKEGCKQAYLQDGQSIQLFYSFIIELFQLVPRAENDTYKISSFMLPFRKTPTTDWTNLAECYYALYGDCKRCTADTIYSESIFISSGFSYKYKECLSRCQDGQYIYVQYDGGLDINMLYLTQSKCEKCHETCKTCFFGGMDQCTSCKSGTYLNILNQELQTGTCDYQIVANSSVNITVTGNRSQIATSLLFPDILTALEAAYQIGHKHMNMTVNIEINYDVEHYILFNDYLAAIDPSDGNQWRYFIDSKGFILNIMQSKIMINMYQIGLKGVSTRKQNVQKKSKFITKQDPIFKFSFLKNSQSGMQYSTLLILFWICNGTSLADGSVIDLMPTFNKWQTCLVRPANGLFILMNFENSRIIRENIVRAIHIKDCEFWNFFYEMNSFVKFPEIAVRQQNPYSFNVTIEGSLFQQISMCGSILSQNQVSPIKQGDSTTQSRNFPQQNYFNYAQLLSIQQKKFVARRFYEPWDSNYEYNVKQKSIITLSQNTFKAFNYLKNFKSDTDSLRIEYSIGSVHTTQLQHFGLIVDLYEQYQSTVLKIEGNTFQDIQYFNKKYPVTIVSNWAGSLYITDNDIRHCIEVFKETFLYSQFSIYDTPTLIKYYQFGHLISVRKGQNATVIISDNTFQNMSLTGPLIYFEEDQDQFQSALALVNNTFKYIMSYAGTNIVQTRRQYDSDTQFTNMRKIPWFTETNDPNIHEVIKYTLMGGNLLILDNIFNQIVGCPTVESSIFKMTVEDNYEPNGRNASQIKRHLQSPIIENMGKWHVQMSLLEQVYNRTYPSLLKVEKSFQHKSRGIVQFDSLRTIFSGNHYSEVSMGVTNLVEGHLYRGSLITLWNTKAVDFQNETFINVGGFTLEHLEQLVFQIKGEAMGFSDKQFLRESFISVPSNLANYKSILTSTNYFNTILSTSLIVSNYQNNLRILGKNTFQNIWLIDRQNAMVKSQSLHTPYDYGLILHVSNIDGYLQIGGPPMLDKNNSMYKDQFTSFNNLTGFLNQESMNMFPDFNSTKWSNLINSLAQNKKEYGLGSVLFNFQSSDNVFQNLTIQNTKFQYIYSRASETISETQFPAILSTTTQQVEYPYYPVNVRIENIEVSDVHYERGSSYFEFHGENVTIKNITIKKIGKFSILEQNIWSQYLPKSIINIDSQFPFFILQQFSYITQYGSLKISNFSLTNSSFTEISPLSGLPIFSLNTLNSLSTQTQLNQILISKTDFFKNMESNIMSNSFLFQETSMNQVAMFNVSFIDTKFEKNQGYYGFFKVLNSVMRVNFIRCTFHENSGVVAKIFYFNLGNIKNFTLQDSLIYENPIQKSNVDSIILKDDQSAFTGGRSLILAIQTTGIIIKDTIVKDIQLCETSALIDITLGSEVQIINSQFEYLSAKLGGAITVSYRSQLKIVGSLFERIAAIRNGVLQVSDYSSIIIEKSIFRNNFALKQGVFKISSESFVKMTDTYFSGNQAEQTNSIGQLIEISENSIFKNVTFSQNQAFYSEQSVGGKGLEILSCEKQITFEECNFKDNLAKSITPNVYIIRVTNILFQGCLFTNSYRHQENELVQGSFMQIIAESEVKIVNSNFFNGYGLQGGAIYLLGQSSATIQGSKFIENTGTLKGGAICAASFANLRVSNGTIFYKNVALNKSGDAISASNSLNIVEILNSEFESQVPSNFIDISDVYSVQLDQSSLLLTSKIYDSKTTKNAGMTLYDIKQVSISRSKFKNLQGSSDYGGGALIIQETDNNKAVTNKFVISQSIFENCFNKNGGAVSFINIANAFIKDQTKFIGNTATFAGGAIYFFCSQDFGIQKEKCTLDIKDSIFDSNLAMIEGGVLKWTFFEPTFTNSTFLNNRALIYGDSLASVAKKIVRISKEQLSLKTLAGRYLQTEEAVSQTPLNQKTLEKVQSGGKMDLYFALIDKYGTIIRTDSSSKLFIRPQKSTTSLAALIETTTQVASINGTFSIEDLIFVGEPNTSQKLMFSTDGINYNVPDNLENYYQSSQSSLKSDKNSTEIIQTSIQDFNIDLNLRSCEEGEELLPNGKCSWCPKEQFLMRAPVTTQLCKDCNFGQTAVCLGGNQVFPTAGNWRSSKYSENMMQCRNQVACLGGQVEEQKNLMGICEEGYQGILCTDCAIGFSRTGSSYSCTVCPPQVDNIFRIIALFCVMIVVMYLLIRSTIRGASQKKSHLSVFLRIMMNHFQLLTLTASFDLEWPKQLQEFFSLTKPVSEVSTQFLSIDCFLDNRSPNSTSLMSTENVSFLNLRVFYQKLIMLALLPFVVIILSFIGWNIEYLYQTYKSKKTISISGGGNKGDTPEQKYAMKVDQEDIQEIQLIGLKKTDELQRQREGGIITTIIVILFMIHPTITRIMFNSFNCQDIDGTRRLYEDLEVVCYEQQHKFLTFSAGLPSLIVWGKFKMEIIANLGLGIPTAGLIIVIRNRDKLNLMDTKSKFGFMYNGYRQKQAFYWEFVIMFRKIIFVFVQVFLAQQGKIVQALTTLLFVVLSMAATAIKQPFDIHYLNNLETISLMSSAITVYCGIFYIADISFKVEADFSLNDQSRLFLFSIIIVSHLIFFVYWIYHFIREIRTTIRTKYPRIYLTLFLCCRKHSLEKELTIERFSLRMEPVTQKMEQLIEYIQSKKSMYNKGQIPLEDEGLKNLLQSTSLFINNSEKAIKFSGKPQNEFVYIDDLIVKEYTTIKPNQLRPDAKKNNKLLISSKVLNGNIKQEHDQDQNLHLMDLSNEYSSRKDHSIEISENRIHEEIKTRRINPTIKIHDLAKEEDLAGENDTSRSNLDDLSQTLALMSSIKTQQHKTKNIPIFTPMPNKNRLNSLDIENEIIDNFDNSQYTTSNLKNNDTQFEEGYAMILVQQRKGANQNKKQRQRDKYFRDQMTKGNISKNRTSQFASKSFKLNDDGKRKFEESQNIIVALDESDNIIESTSSLIDNFGKQARS